MATIKDNINSVTNETENLVKDYLKLFSIRQTEKIALFFGILASVFIISTLLLIVIIFCSVALANHINSLFAHPYWGYWMVAGIYLITAITLVVAAIKSKKPLLTNLFVKLIGFVMNLDADRNSTLTDLQREKETINSKIEADKANIKIEVQMMKYSFMESFFKEIFNLFKSKKKKPEDAEPQKEETKNPESEETGL